jgi:hypothetical protein
MKNKIILLLVLLIPSLGFAKSVRISFNNISKTTLTITFLDAYTQGLTKEGKGHLNEFYLKKHNGKFLYTENEDAFTSIATRMGLMFTNKEMTNVDSAFDTTWIRNFKKQREITYGKIVTTIETLFVFRGYTVNFIDRIGGSSNMTNYYISKP